MGRATGVASTLRVSVFQLTLSLVRCFTLNLFPICGKLSRIIFKNGDQEKEAGLGVGMGLNGGS